MAACKQQDLRVAKYGLTEVEANSFNMLKGDTYDLLDLNGAKVDEFAKFEQTFTSLVRSGFTQEDIDNVLDVIVALLHLGQITFQDDTTAMIVSNEPILKAAPLLKIEPDALVKCILKKTVKYPGQVIEVEHSKGEALNVLHSLIKSVYSRLFDSMVKKINSGL